MSESRTVRLNKVLRELNISLDRAVEYLAKNGHQIEARPTTKISSEIYQVLQDGFETDANKKAASKEVGEEKRKEKEAIRLELEAKIEKKRLEDEKKEEVLRAKAEKLQIKTVGKIDIEAKKAEVKSEPVVDQKIESKEEEKEAIPPANDTQEKEVEQAPKETDKKPSEPSEQKEVITDSVQDLESKKEVVSEKTEQTESSEPSEQSETIKTQYKKLNGPKLTGKKIDLKQFEKVKKKPEDKSKTPAKNDASKRKRKRISKPGAPGQGNQNRASGVVRPGGSRPGSNRPGGSRGGNAQRRPAPVKRELTEAEVQKQVRETLEKLQGKSSKGKGAKYRRNKRDAHKELSDAETEAQVLGSKVLKVTEFVTVSEVATMMEVAVTEIISACMMLGMMVTMNQRLPTINIGAL